jgi:SAM-dependent methyltransferase
MGTPRRLALRAGVIPYRPTISSEHRWMESYRSGELDYFQDLVELPRYSILVGYISYLGGHPSILDVGCGQGLLRARLDAVRFRRYVGVDPTEAAIEQARHWTDERTTFVVGTLSELGPDPDRFDIAVLNEVLSIVSDPAGLLDEVAARLWPEGHLVACNWRHPGDGQLWRVVDDRFERMDMVEARNPANRIALNGWRMACYRRRSG